jgi:hypothetical protein
VPLGAIPACKLRNWGSQTLCTAHQKIVVRIAGEARLVVEGEVWGALKTPSAAGEVHLVFHFAAVRSRPVPKCMHTTQAQAHEPGFGAKWILSHIQVAAGLIQMHVKFTKSVSVAIQVAPASSAIQFAPASSDLRHMLNS